MGGYFWEENILRKCIKLIFGGNNADFKLNTFVRLEVLPRSGWGAGRKL